MTTKPVIVLDADGVLLDYHHAYRQVWQKAFGVLPELADPQAYFPIHRWKVPMLDVAQRNHLRECQDEVFWSTLPAIGGALDAALSLDAAGFELICVSALPLKFEAARLKNIRDLGFPIKRVYATPVNPDNEPNRSVKAGALETILPVAFVDDYAPYLRGIPTSVHAALIMREPNGSPNVGEDLALAHSKHEDLSAFARWWLKRKH
ncbi:HAD family hydrolase [Rhodoferax ferrireducens]|uniref:HAD family hydrolase n=1 Tax=Rhodoferax ferrireducens TaxID=192843 RepID=UPI00298E638F|nr:HAD family hydrolase [Rhodoferax ferrireducens]WPC68009.1 HAD family hydrolase [Rhodoferax ferrireducens]